MQNEASIGANKQFFSATAVSTAHTMEFDCKAIREEHSFGDGQSQEKDQSAQLLVQQH